MLLLTGPPGSGKTHYLLDRIRGALRSSRSDFRLLVPTATMAEHLRNEMAREGFVFRPSLISTLSKFVASWVEDLPEVTGPSLNLLVEGVVRRLSVREFQAVAGFPGFHASLAGLIDEISSAGWDSRRLAAALENLSREAPLAGAFLAVFAEVENRLIQRRLALRSQRLQRAAQRIHEEGLPGVREILLDGFFSLTDPELAVVDSLRRHAETIVTLPSWPGAENARATLMSMGFTEKQLERVRPEPEVLFSPAPTMDQEVEEIARRILHQSGNGRPFREMGIVVRGPEPYMPALRAVLERFGIPARFYFSTRLAEHPPVPFFSGVLDALIGGWDHEQTLDVLRMSATGFGASAAMDRFDFRVRERMPGEGLEPLRGLANDERLLDLIDALLALDSWRQVRAGPLEWAQRVSGLTRLHRPQRPTDPATHEMTAVWRGHAAALQAFEEAIRETAEALEPEKSISLSEFWSEAKAVLRLTALRVPDHRRNVVHVLDVYEARQWELPVVFVCGLLEKQFPLYHSQHPILPDGARRLLQKSGLRLRTSADRDREEQFLFEFATTRATNTLVLSYPRFNQAGDENLRSFFLDKFAAEGQPGLQQPRVRPEPLLSRAPERRSVLRDSELLGWVRSRHAALSPTAIETFLECPFQFFARHTLKLEGPPTEPFQRLDTLAQGSIVHRTLADWVVERGPLEPLFERAFRGICEKGRVPPGYRTEAVRLELLRNIQRFLPVAAFEGVFKSEVERSFRLDLGGDLALRGQIDRIDHMTGGEAVVVDYKYSRSSKVRERVKQHEDGKRVQGGLYLLAVEEKLVCKVAGVLFAGLRGEPAWDGWHVPREELKLVGTSATPEFLRELADLARKVSVAAAGEIREGRVAPDPADPDICTYCEFRDICRVETAAKVVTAQGTEE